MQSKKKKNKRDQTKYPALDKVYNLRTRKELLDFDYINGYTDEETGMSIRPLNDKEKEFLNNFTSEYINAEFKPKRKRIMKKKRAEHPNNASLRKLNKILLDYIKQMNNNVKNSNIGSSSKITLRRAISKFKIELKKKIKREFHFIKDYYKKEAYDNNNSRNRCILTRAKAQGKSMSIDELPEHFAGSNNVEDELIERLDLMKESKNSKNNTGNS